jgi:UDP-N-acetyl-D-glucosamine dehydrogenase
VRVAVIGQGYVGLSVSIASATAGYNTIGIDVNEQLVDRLNNGISHIPDIGNKEIKKLISEKSISFSTNIRLLSSCQIIVIAVPTPVTNHQFPDMSYLRSACEAISKHGQENTLVINESTSYPGTLRDFIKPIADPESKGKFLFASAPERIDPGNLNWNISNTPRVVSGLTKEATNGAKSFYSKFCNEIHIAPSPEAAEAAKIFENTFRQVNIALVNEFSNSMYQLGLSATDALTAAATKPFGFMSFLPGIGVGGHCIPVDPYYFTQLLKQRGLNSPLIDAANRVNLLQPSLIVDRILELNDGSVSGLKIQLAGISYKIDTPDLRESPALELMSKLKELKALVTWCDPVIGEYDGVKSQSLSDNIDIGLIITPHSSINFESWKKSKIKVYDLSTTRTDYGWDKFF